MYSFLTNIKLPELKPIFPSSIHNNEEHLTINSCHYTLGKKINFIFEFSKLSEMGLPGYMHLEWNDDSSDDNDYRYDN